jgi:hypothetical protein
MVKLLILAVCIERCEPVTIGKNNRANTSLLFPFNGEFWLMPELPFLF